MLSANTVFELVGWLVVGYLAGNWVGRLVTLKKQGFGRWINLVVGMAGALLGGWLFRGLLPTRWGLADLKLTAEDLVAALIGSLVLVLAWWLIGLFRRKKS